MWLAALIMFCVFHYQWVFSPNLWLICHELLLNLQVASWKPYKRFCCCQLGRAAGWRFAPLVGLILQVLQQEKGLQPQKISCAKNCRLTTFPSGW